MRAALLQLLLLAAARAAAAAAVAEHQSPAEAFPEANQDTLGGPQQERPLSPEASMPYWFEGLAQLPPTNVSSLDPAAGGTPGAPPRVALETAAAPQSFVLGELEQLRAEVSVRGPPAVLGLRRALLGLLLLTIGAWTISALSVPAIKGVPPKQEQRAEQPAGDSLMLRAGCRILGYLSPFWGAALEAGELLSQAFKEAPPPPPEPNLRQRAVAHVKEHRLLVATEGSMLLIGLSFFIWGLRASYRSAPRALAYRLARRAARTAAN